MGNETVARIRPAFFRTPQCATASSATVRMKSAPNKKWSKRGTSLADKYRGDHGDLIIDERVRVNELRRGHEPAALQVQIGNSQVINQRIVK